MARALGACASLYVYVQVCACLCLCMCMLVLMLVRACAHAQACTCACVCVDVCGGVCAWSKCTFFFLSFLGASFAAEKHTSISVSTFPVSVLEMHSALSVSDAYLFFQPFWFFFSRKKKNKRREKSK